MGLIQCDSKNSRDINLKIVRNTNYSFKGILSIKDLSTQILLSADLVIIADEPMKVRNYINIYRTEESNPDIWHRSSSPNKITELCRFMGTPIIICTYSFYNDINVDQKDYGDMRPECRYSITDNTYMSDIVELPYILKKLNMSSVTHNILIIEGYFNSQKGCKDLWDLLV